MSSNRVLKIWTAAPSGACRPSAACKNAAAFIFAILLVTLNPAGVNTAGIAALSAAEAVTLQGVHQSIVSRFPQVEHLSPQALGEILTARRDVLLFDTRAKEEYAVSRLPGSIHVDPGIGHDAFMRRYAATVRGKKVIFYCAVGHRSSRLNSRLKEGLLAAGAGAVHNLEGGVIGWHNEGRELENDAGRTDFIHPYSKSWGRLIVRQALIRYKPGI